MAIHKIQIIDLLSVDYELIAIHTPIEDYRLAYFLNKTLNIKLSKNNSKIEIKTSEGKSTFNHYFYDDKETDIQWSLVENKTSIASNKTKIQGLFDDLELSVFLLPEFKKADYLLKIENIDSYFNPEEYLYKIESVSQIIKSYTINQDKIKTKQNLIF